MLSNKKIQKGIYVWIVLCAFLFMSQRIFVHAQTQQKVTYNGDTVDYTGKSIYVDCNNADIDMGNTPGLILDGTYMISYKKVFEKGLDVSCSYDEGEKKLTMSKFNNTVVMYLGNGVALVNGTQIAMDHAPIEVTYESSGEKVILVDVKFAAEALGYDYQKTIHSDTEATVRFTNPIFLTYDGVSHAYNDKKVGITYNGKKLNMDITGIVVDEQLLFPVKEVYTNSRVGGTYSYDQTKKTVTLKLNGNTVKLYADSKNALVNGKSYTLPTKTRVVKVNSTGKEYIFASGEFLAEQLQCEYQWKETSSTAKLTSIKGSYVLWNTTPKVLTGNYGKKVSVSRSGNYDIITVDCKKNPSISVKKSGKSVYITIKNFKINGNYNKAISGKKISKVSVAQKGSNVQIVIQKKSASTPFVRQVGGKKLIITMGKKPIKIGVDCGHGSNTPGKRSPAMPCNIDFDGDGVIDVKRGKSIKEHQGNVGVGKYLAAELERCGFDVCRVAFGSKDLSLGTRQRMIRKYGCKYSISVHFNAVGNGRTFNKASGVEVLYHKSNSKAKSSKSFAKNILREMSKGTKQLNRGVKRQNLAMCNAATMKTKASILVECAFMTNLHEAKTMFGNAKFWRETAKEIARGVCKSAGVTYISE